MSPISLADELQVSCAGKHAAPLAVASRAARMALHPESSTVFELVPGAFAERAGPVATGGRRSRATAPPRSARLAALALAAAALACDPYVQGNGVYLEVQRTPGPFAGVHVDDGIAVTAAVAAGSGYGVVVSGDANMLDYVRTEVQALDVRGEPVDVLRIWVDEPSGGYAPTIPIRATLQAPGLRYAGAIQAARIEARDVTAADLDVEASGGADLEVKGPGGATLHATVADATADLGSWVVTTYADVMATGHARVEVAATGTLTGEAHGTSVVQNLATAAVCDLASFDTAAVTCGPTPP
jgi:putative autotransporter adhesin-like protein